MTVIARTESDKLILQKYAYAYETAQLLHRLHYNLHMKEVLRMMMMIIIKIFDTDSRIQCKCDIFWFYYFVLCGQNTA